jgi:arabinogalactan endo-1,4-beta-galactosidase
MWLRALTRPQLVGVSFYPFYGKSATLANLKSSLTALVNKLGKDVFIAETNWPEACSGVTLSEPSVPVSAAGQQTWVKDVVAVMNALPGGHGVGICASAWCAVLGVADDAAAVYWEPGWIGNANLGSSCSVRALRRAWNAMLMRRAG